jgi:transmembrane sensor
MQLRLPKTEAMLRREAASWLARLQSGRDPDIALKVEQWRARDARHAAAFERICRTYDQAALLRHSQLASDRRAVAQRPIPQQRRFALAAAAAAVVLVPAGALMLGRAMSTIRGTEAVLLATQLGEIRSVALGDGSRVTLDTATTVQVEVGRSRRMVRLKSGRARFDVAPAATPFVVEAGGTTVTAQSGVIDVARTAGRSEVEVISGAAEVRHDGSGLTLRAGQGAAGQHALERIEGSSRRPDWTRGMLEFDGTPLAEAVELANRYSERRIRLSPGIGSARVTGAFRAGDTTGLARALAQAFHLSVSRKADGSLLLSRKASLSADE